MNHWAKMNLAAMDWWDREKIDANRIANGLPPISDELYRCVMEEIERSKKDHSHFIREHFRILEHDGTTRKPTEEEIKKAVQFITQ